jgi:hypothetical protein
MLLRKEALTVAEPHRIYEEPQDRAARLDQLDLTEQLMEDIVVYGAAARSACSPFHPPSYPGYAQWADMHHAARVRLVPAGWKADDSRNFSRVVHPDGHTAFTVATGDERTGKPGLPEPRTKYPRGRETVLAININRQLSLFDELEEEDAEAVMRPRRETWTLLVATTESEVRYELSLGSSQDSDGRIIGWSERILFPALDMTAHTPDDDDDDDGGSGEIDVPVERI